MATVPVKRFSGADKVKYPLRYAIFHKTIEAYIDSQYQVTDAVMSAVEYDETAKRPTNRYLLVEFIADVERAIFDGIGDDDELYADLQTYIQGLAGNPANKVPEKAKANFITLVGRLFLERGLDPTHYFLRIKKKAVA